jgi:DNA mismatch endonuclease (patch repair protein)
MLPRDADLPYPVPSSAAVTALMKGNRRSDTKPEQLLRSHLHRDGLRFRKDRLVRAGNIKVKPDVVFTRDRVAVFVDGCFWHGCPDHGRQPRVNADYWGPKLARNAERDARVDAALGEDGWAVVRVWEHTDPAEAARVVQAAIRCRRPTDRAPAPA